MLYSFSSYLLSRTRWGYGRYEYADGSKYVGQFVADKKEGQGELGGAGWVAQGRGRVGGTGEGQDGWCRRGRWVAVKTRREGRVDRRNFYLPQLLNSRTRV